MSNTLSDRVEVRFEFGAHQHRQELDGYGDNLNVLLDGAGLSVVGPLLSEQRCGFKPYIGHPSPNN